MTATFHAPAAPQSAEIETSTQGFVWYMGVAWIVLWLTNLVDVVDAYTPFFPLFYPFIGVYVIYFGMTRANQLPALVARPVFAIWTITAVIPILMYFTSSLGPHAYVSMRNRVIGYAVIAGTGLLLTDRRGPDLLRQAGVIALAIAIPFNFIEFAFGNILGTATGRAAGFHINPNASASALIISLLLAVDFTRHTRRGLFLVCATLLAVLVTFSRAGMLFTIFLTLAYIFLPQGRHSLSAASRLGIVFGGTIVLGLVIGAALTFMSLDWNASSRLVSILTLDFSDGSTAGRLQNVQFGVEHFLENFWTGKGLGTPDAYNMALHNSFMYVAVEFGIFGLILFMTVLSLGILKVVQHGWMAALNLSLLSGYLLYNSIFDHYVHVNAMFSIAFAVIMTDGLVPRAPARMPAPEQTTTLYTFQ